MEKIWLQSYPQNVPTDLEFDPNETIASLLLQACQNKPDQVAFINHGIKLTFNELEQKSYRLARYFQIAYSLEPGDKIAIMMPNLLQYPIIYFAAILAGLIIVNINPLYTAPELQFVLKDAQLKAIVILENFAYILQKALQSYPVKHVMVTRIGDCFPLLKSQLANLYVKYVKKLVPSWSIPQAIMYQETMTCQLSEELEMPKLIGTDIAMLQYTGGTTGKTKAAILTHANLVANVKQISAWFTGANFELTSILVPLPLYHIFALTVGLLTMPYLGITALLITNPRDLMGLINDLKKYPVDAMIGVNTLFKALAEHKDFHRLDFSQLKFALGGGAAISATVAKRWQQITEKPMLEGYGLTEASPVVTIMPLNQKSHHDGIGLPIPSTEIKIVDDNDREVTQGEIGELCIRGPQVMSGYWNAQEETELAFTKDRWLRSGDIARVDEQGYVFIVDRKKDMVLVSGFNVYPTEVEEVLMSLAGVLEAGVVGEPCEKTGEKVVAYLVSDGSKLDPDMIIAQCRESLTAYKVPREIKICDSLPKSPIGKVLRKDLKEL